jgi:hypothetical protein
MGLQMAICQQRLECIMERNSTHMCRLLGASGTPLRRSNSSCSNHKFLIL